MRASAAGGGGHGHLEEQVMKVTMRDISTIQPYRGNPRRNAAAVEGAEEEDL